jgi:hypothetical protein
MQKLSKQQTLISGKSNFDQQDTLNSRRYIMSAPRIIWSIFETMSLHQYFTFGHCFLNTFLFTGEPVISFSKTMEWLKQQAVLCIVHSVLVTEYLVDD